jgi:CheY-like chemotaxis protein
VTDTGPGIAPEQQALLFHPFSQVDDTPTRRHGGSGLGLSIVARLAQLLGGEVGVDSRPGGGSRFWFQVPVQPLPTDGGTPPPATIGVPLPVPVPGAGERRAPAEVADMAPATAWRFAGRVLMAEDDPANREFLTRALERMGLTVQPTVDGEEALRALEEAGSFDAVLLDVRMPGIDGMEVARRIRQRESREGLARCPVVAVTANAFEEDRRACLDAGMDAVLAKPVLIAELGTTLARWLPGSTNVPPAPQLPAGLPSRTSDEAPISPLPRGLLDEQVAQLQSLIGRRLFDAIGAVESLREAVRGSALEAGLDPVATALEVLDFDLADRALSQWRLRIDPILSG